MIIKQAQSASEINDIRSLFREYEAMLQVDLCFQNFEHEIAHLPGKYAEPDGHLLIAYHNQEALGCVAIRKIDDAICEMKRLFVRPAARGSGLGKQLAQDIISIAQNMGYKAMRLDTLERLAPAVQLYKSLGFKNIPAYYDNPTEGVVYLELNW